MQASFFAKLKQHFDDQQFTDVTFQFAGDTETLSAHRLVLSCVSEPFAALLSLSKDDGPIELPSQFDRSTFKFCLECTYDSAGTFCPDYLSIEFVRKVWDMGVYYVIPQAVVRALVHLQQNLTTVNVLGVLQHVLVLKADAKLWPLVHEEGQVLIQHCTELFLTNAPLALRCCNLA